MKKKATKKPRPTKAQRERTERRAALRAKIDRAKERHQPHVSAKLSKRSDVTESLQHIFEKGVLVDLSIGFWTAMNRNTARDLGIRDEDRLPENIAGLGMKRLIEKEFADGWKAVAAHARYKLRTASFLFPVGQASFVPIKALPRLEEELFGLKEQFDKAARALGSDWDEIKAAMLKKYPKLNEAQYPAKSEVMSQFYFDWSVYNVTLPRKAQLAQFNKKKAKHDEEVLARYRGELEERMTSFLAESVTTLRVKTIDLCVTIGQSINAGRIVTDRSLTTLRNFIDRFAELNFVGDKEVEKRLDKLKREVLGERTREDFEESPELQGALATALDEVRKAAEAVTDVGSIAGGYQRRIRV
jgi:hypothetical protein